jgi:uncharacterized protein YkwD
MPTRLPRLACVALAVALMAFPSVAQAKPTDRDPILDQIDAARASYGLRPFKFAPSLARSSRSWARTLMRADAFSHSNPIKAAGNFKRHGEALGYATGWRLNRGSMVQMWLNSPTHRALLLSRSLRYIGAGKVRGRLGSRLTTIWVLHFGAR